MNKWDAALAISSLAAITVLAAIYDEELIYVAVGWASGILSALGFHKAAEKK